MGLELMPTEQVSSGKGMWAKSAFIWLLFRVLYWVFVLVSDSLPKM